MSEAPHDKDTHRADVATLFSSALAHYIGDGVPVDMCKAARLYKEAAAKGHADSQNNLGSMMLKGQHAPDCTIDYAGARELFARSAAQNTPHAQFNLATMLESGRGGEPDHTLAWPYFRLAATHKLPSAMYAVALLTIYRRGRPNQPPLTLRMRREALALATKAAERGYPGARDLEHAIRRGLDRSIARIEKSGRSSASLRMRFR